MRILVIDDDPDMIQFIRLMLEVEGHEVLVAQSGIQGYFMARKESPDVVLLDIMLPDIDGYEVYRKIRLNEETHGIPVIFVSARSKSDQVEYGMSLGVQAYITKPFRPEELLKKLEDISG